MKQRQKLLLAICIFGMVLSLAYYIRRNPNIVGEIKAPVHINIEINKDHIQNIMIVASLNNFDSDFFLSPTSITDASVHSVILYTNVKNSKQIPFVQALYLQIPQKTARETLDAIEGISIFIGNKLFYFSHTDILSLQSKEQDGNLLYFLPGLKYQKSFMGSWINWYGDLNLAVKTITVFFIYPAKFIITWFFFLCFLFLCKENIMNNYNSLRKRKYFLEILLLTIVILAGFFLRFNGYVRFSSWVDELYSGNIASNPHRSFLSTFEDPGNPPFYFILLRLWFTIFGWSEQSGRLLSVILGTAAIVSLYIFVKQFAGKKTAFLSALLMITNNYAIGFSQEMRGYILEVFIVSIISLRFLIFIRRQNIMNLLWYIIPSILLVNTHYYGSILIFAIFLFFIFYTIEEKKFSLRNTIVFFTGNIIIAFSLLPFFLHTALSKALLDQNFNSAIPKIGFLWMCAAILILILLIFYLCLRKTNLWKRLFESRRYVLDYSFFVTTVVFFIVFGLSLIRPMLTNRYLVILLPLLLAILGVLLASLMQYAHSKTITCLYAFGIYICILNGYQMELWGYSDLYQEGAAYISLDSAAHGKNKNMFLHPAVWLEMPDEDFYGNIQLPPFTPGDKYDVLYANPCYGGDFFAEIKRADINTGKMLRIWINETASVWKIYW